MAVQTVIVQIQISSATVARQSFDSILIAGFHEIPGPLVRPISSIQELEQLGITQAALPSVWRPFNVAFSQSPRPRELFLGRRDNAPAQSINLIPIVPTIPVGQTLDFIVVVEGQTATYVAVSGDGVAEVIIGVKAAIDALAVPALPTTTTDNGPGTSLQVDVDQGAAAGRILTFVADRSQWILVNQTADPGVTADLSAIRGENESTYALVLDSNSEAELLAASVWAQSRTVLLFGEAENGEHVNPAVTDDLGSQLRDLNNDRTSLVFTNQQVGLSYAAATVAERFPAAGPGESNWAYKTPRAVPAYDLLQSEANALSDKRVNMFTFVEGSPGTLFGYVSGTLRFVDQIRGVDALEARIRENLTQLLFLEPVVQYDNIGINQVRANVLATIQTFITQPGNTKLLAADPAPVVQVPLAVDVDAIDRAERVLRNVTFLAQLAGAINTIVIDGTVTV